MEKGLVAPHFPVVPSTRERGSRNGLWEGWSRAGSWLSGLRTEDRGPRFCGFHPEPRSASQYSLCMNCFSKAAYDSCDFLSAREATIDERGVVLVLPFPPYSKYHQFGTERIPARPFYGISDELKEKIATEYQHRIFQFLITG